VARRVLTAASRRPSSVASSVRVADAIEAAEGTDGELVNVSTVPPVIVFDAVAHTAVAFAAAVGADVYAELASLDDTVVSKFASFVLLLSISARICAGVTDAGALVSVVAVSTRPPVMVRDAAAQTAVALVAEVGRAASCVSRLALAIPSASRTFAAVSVAVPVVLSTGTPKATVPAFGTAQVPTRPPP